MMHTELDADGAVLGQWDDGLPDPPEPLTPAIVVAAIRQAVGTPLAGLTSESSLAAVLAALIAARTALSSL